MNKTGVAPSLILAFCTFLYPVPIKAEVTYEGLSVELEASARALMPLASASCDSTRWRVERLFLDAGENLTKSLQATGYYRASFSKTLSWEEDCWHAVFEVEPGAPVRYRLVNVQVNGPAAHDSDFSQRFTLNRPIPGETLDHAHYEKYKNALVSSAMSLGYFDARYERSEVLVDPSALAADLNMILTSGERYRIGAISFTGGIIRDSLLHGYTDIRPGDLYRTGTINELREALSASTYFGSVSINTSPIDELGKTVPINVALEPAARRIYSIGLGFATDTGPQGRLGFNNRRVNTRGHQLESRLFASKIKTELTGSYRFPRNDPRREWFSILGGVQHEDTDTSSSDTSKLGILYSRNASARWLETRYVDYVNERFTVADNQQSSNLVIFGINWEAVKGRDLSRALAGWRLNIDIRGASESLGSDTGFLQFRTTAKWVYSFSDKTRVLARTRLGITTMDRLDELPASIRFFAGGDQSIRGYGFETLGPTNAAGTVIGGNNLFEGSVELERLVKDQWAIAAFIDSGNAFNSTDLNAKTGIGFGLRWYSPLGPVKLDLAHPLDDQDRAIRIHVILGPDL
ncbi:MAG: translocation and assembly module TamA [Rhodothermales bacterium]|jgi:translocation and assembly module TamA